MGDEYQKKVRWRQKNVKTIRAGRKAKKKNSCRLKGYFFCQKVHWNFFSKTLPYPRYNKDLNLPKCRLTTGQRTFAFRGAKLYNELPRDIKETADSKVFKKKLNNLLISKQL